MIIAQITDTHVRHKGGLAYERVATDLMLEAAVRHLNTMRPQPTVVVATGDLCDRGAAEEYTHLRAILSEFEMPVFLIPGNHDDRAALRDAFSDHAYLPKDGDFLHYAVDDYPVRLIGLDTVVPGEAGGHLCAERLDWLAERLDAGPARPTVLFMHHPPFATGVKHMDEIGLDGAEALAEIVARHPQIERILCGHLHRPIQMRWHGTLVSTAPSTAHQVVLDLRHDAPAEFNMEPPACQLHVWDAAQGLVSHTSYIGRFEGPYRFFPDAE
jgi:3',5'-cyclic AMP phosphodiesterase CpdA